MSSLSDVCCSNYQWQWWYREHWSDEAKAKVIQGEVYNSPSALLQTPGEKRKHIENMEKLSNLKCKSQTLDSLDGFPKKHGKDGCSSVVLTLSVWEFSPNNPVFMGWVGLGWVGGSLSWVKYRASNKSEAGVRGVSAHLQASLCQWRGKVHKMRMIMMQMQMLMMSRRLTRTSARFAPKLAHTR